MTGLLDPFSRPVALFDSHGEGGVSSGETPDESRPDRGDFSPVLITEVELTEPLPELPTEEQARSYGGAWVLVRHHSEPLAVVRLGFGPSTTGAALRETIAAELGTLLRTRLGADAEQIPERLALGGSPTEAGAPFLEEREHALRSGPPISIVLCTRGRAESLARTLDSLATQQYPRFEVVVVDNTSGDPAVETLTRRSGRDIPVQYVIEPRTGLSRARNRGTASASGDIVAFIDDDEVADQYWLAELSRGYLVGQDVAAVSGAILPAALDTQAQDWFEQYGGHSKARGFSQEVFPGSQSPIYPLPPFGAGGNMSFRKASLAEIGGFDIALGAGTPARGGEDTAAFSRAMLAGYKVVYRPSALVWHHHYVDLDGIRRQLAAYGSGLTAYYTALLWSDPRLAFKLIPLIPRALQDMFGRESVRTSSIRDDFPPSLLKAHRRGMLRGPWAYVRGRRDATATESVAA